MRKLIDVYGLRDPILSLARTGAPLLGHLRRHDPACRPHRGRRRAGLLPRRHRGAAQRLRAPARLASRPISTSRPSARSRSTASSSERPLVTDVGPMVEVLARDPDGRAGRRPRRVACWPPPSIRSSPGSPLAPAPGRDDRAEARRGRRDRASSGRSAAARLTDRQALTDLSRRVHAASDAHRRSLGVPAPSAGTPRISLSTLMPSWLPLRAPSVHLVAEVGRRARRQLPGHRGAAPRRLGHHRARRGRRPDGRPRSAIELLDALVEEGARHNVARFHAACADVRENLELFGQAGFMAYAQEEIWWRAPEPAQGPRSWLRSAGRAVDGRDGAGRPTTSSSSRPARRTRGTCSTCGPTPRRRPSPGSRATHAADWESVGQRGDRAALRPQPDPPLQPRSRRLAAAGGAAGRRIRAARCLSRRAALPPLPGPRRRRRRRDSCAPCSARIGREAIAAGILAPVRTYESAGTRAAQDSGFEPIGRVTLLVREVRAQVREPAMVPAIR